MAKISKETKFRVLIEYGTGKFSLRSVAIKYGIGLKNFQMLVAAYESYGKAALFNRPKVTPEFRVSVSQWAVRYKASYTEVAAKFGYTAKLQI